MSVLPKKPEIVIFAGPNGSGKRNGKNRHILMNVLIGSMKTSEC